MNWRLKSLIRHTMLALPGGVNLYRWLTQEVVGTNAGMAYKWFRVLPTRVQVLQAHFGDRARDQRLWCFDCGATPAAGLAMAVASDAPGLLTDRIDRMSSRYCDISRRVLLEKGPALAELSQAPSDRITCISSATAHQTAGAALAAINMSYTPNYTIVTEPKWKGTIGCVFSAGTLEHYPPDSLESILTTMEQALQPNGIMCHTIDHRDHRWHADKRLSPLAHLTLEEATFTRRFGNRLEYHNRWLRSDYVSLFSHLGFQVECHDVFSYTADLTPLDRSRLVDPFRHRSDDDLLHLVSLFVVSRA